MDSPYLQDVSAPHEFYPEPIPIITATIIAHREDNPLSVAMIELTRPAADGKLLVLPGGIWDLKRHTSPLQCGVKELEEETGLKFGSPPQWFAQSLRRSVDQRRWCSHATTHCCDFVLAGPVVGEIKVHDKEEVRHAKFVDLTSLDLTTVGRGHDALIRAWIVANHNVNFESQFPALSNDSTLFELQSGIIVIRDR